MGAFWFFAGFRHLEQRGQCLVKYLLIKLEKDNMVDDCLYLWWAWILFDGHQGIGPTGALNGIFSALESVCAPQLPLMSARSLAGCETGN